MLGLRSNRTRFLLVAAVVAAVVVTALLVVVFGVVGVDNAMVVIVDFVVSTGFLKSASSTPTVTIESAVIIDCIVCFQIAALVVIVRFLKGGKSEVRNDERSALQDNSETC